MSLPSSVIVNVVFLAFYALLLAPTIFNLARHRLGRQGGFVYVLIFCLARILGNALLIAAYKENYSNGNVLEAGLVLQGLGYAFIFSAALGFYTSATTDPGSPLPTKFGLFALRNMIRDRDTPLRHHLQTILNMVNTVALILLIVGYTNSNDLFTLPANPHAKLDTLAKVGDILFLLITAVLAAMTIKNIVGGARQTNETRPILYAIMIALPFMLIRAIFVTVQAFEVNPFGQSIALRAVFQYSAEAIVDAIFTIMGLLLLRHATSQQDVESTIDGQDDK